VSDSGSDHAPLPRSIGWLLNVAYAALLLAVSPLLIYRSITQGKYRSGWNEKLLGRVPELPPVAVGRKRYWFHAVSVGEVLLLRSVLTELQRREPDAELVVSTTTSTGHAVAREKFAFATVCYFPLDFTWAVNTAIERIKPTQFVLVELELWPNILSSIARHGVPLSLINGRLSEHSSRGYAKARWLLRPLLQSFHQIAVQNETYAERFRLLGASSQSVVVTGSVKFDGVETQRNNDRTQMLRASFGLGSDEPVFIAGSTQAPEEEIAIAAWQRARQVEPGLRLVLVPRHKERFADVAEQVTSSGLTLLRRTASSETLSGPSPLWGEGGRRPEEGESSVAADGSVGAAPLTPCGHPLPRGERGFDESRFCCLTRWGNSRRAGGSRTLRLWVGASPIAVGRT
jgi:3-deoxy-D-manno-octulosonic-acid transferase